jgi:hypothetical protein
MLYFSSKNKGRCHKIWVCPTIVKRDMCDLCIIWGGGYTSYEEEEEDTRHMRRRIHKRDMCDLCMMMVLSDIWITCLQASAVPGRERDPTLPDYLLSAAQALEEVEPRERCFYWDKVIGGRFPRRTCLQNSHSQRERCLDLHRLIGVPHESSSSYDACLLG